MELNFRLDLLRKAQQIDDEVHRGMLQVIDLFKDKWGIELTEENGQMMVTHLSMALMRVKRGEPVKEMEEEVFEDVMESRFFTRAQEILGDMGRVLPVELPEGERKYMLVNNTLILENFYEGEN